MFVNSEVSLHCWLWKSRVDYADVSGTRLRSITTSKKTLVKFTYPGQRPKIPSPYQISDFHEIFYTLPGHRVSLVSF